MQELFSYTGAKSYDGRDGRMAVISILTSLLYITKRGARLRAVIYTRKTRAQNGTTRGRNCKRCSSATYTEGSAKDLREESTVNHNALNTATRARCES